MKSFYVLFMMIILLTATACEIAPTPQLSVSHDHLEVSVDGGMVTLSVNAVGELATKPMRLALLTLKTDRRRTVPRAG